MIKGIGVDIIELDRIKKIIEQETAFFKTHIIGRRNDIIQSITFLPKKN